VDTIVDQLWLRRAVIIERTQEIGAGVALAATITLRRRRRTSPHADLLRAGRRAIHPRRLCGGLHMRRLGAMRHLVIVRCALGLLIAARVSDPS
jgi:hypothetical protein